MSNIRRENEKNQRVRGSLSLRDAMSRLFDESIWDPFENYPLVNEDGGAFPKVDIYDNDKEVTVSANIPGGNPKNIDVEVDEDSLTLSGVVEEEREDEEKNYYYYEREYGEFRRDLLLPSKVDKDNVKAFSKDGVLTITLPKVPEEASGRKKIEISGK